MTEIWKRFTSRFRDSLGRHPREVLRQFAGHPSSRTFFVLAVVLALGLYFRLWNIEHLFSIIHDYDEGAYSLAGRFISEGYVPYRDFLFVHPPVYVYVLAVLHKLFGYGFFVGRYLSVAASIGSGLLLFFAGRKLYSADRAGIVAAAFMLLETQMVYLGRRTVQESLGLLLVAGALVLVATYLAGNTRRRVLIPAGVLLGVAVAVKYIMAPAALGIVLGLAVVELPESTWQRLRLLGRPLLIAVWGCASLACYSLLILVRWVGLVRLPLPFSDVMSPGVESWIVTLWVFVLPFLVALFVVVPRERQRLDGAVLRALVTGRASWLLAACVLAGFFAVTAYFWISMPGEFLRQTVFFQGNRPSTEFPSLVAFVRAFGVGTYLGFLRMSMLPVLFVVPAILMLLNRRVFSRNDCFLAVALAGGLFLCQWFYHLPRYYASVFPLLFLGVSWMAPSLQSGPLTARSKAGLAFLLAAMLMSMNVSVTLLRNYTAYDTLWPVYSSEEEYVYQETAQYFRSVDARRVYVTSPAYVAMAGDLESTLAFDTFAVLWLEKVPAEEIVERLRAEGVDYIGIDRWSREWGAPYDEALQALVNEIRLQAQAVHVISPDSLNKVEIYRLTDARPVISNGDFAYWSDYEDMKIPIGWTPVLVGGAGDAADIRPSGIGEGGVRLIIYEDGLTEPGTTSTHAGLSRRMAFPRRDVSVTVLPGLNTESLGATPLGPAIHFLDGEGHSVILGFSDTIEEEQEAVCSECGEVAVIQPAPLHRWSEHSINVAKYWMEAGWEVPEELTVLVVLSAHSDYPGYYTFHVGSVTSDSPT